MRPSVLADGRGRPARRRAFGQAGPRQGGSGARRQCQRARQPRRHSAARCRVERQSGGRGVPDRAGRACQCEPRRRRFHADGLCRHQERSQDGGTAARERGGRQGGRPFRRHAAPSGGGPGLSEDCRIDAGARRRRERARQERCRAAGRSGRARLCGSGRHAGCPRRPYRRRESRTRRNAAQRGGGKGQPSDRGAAARQGSRSQSPRPQRADAIGERGARAAPGGRRTAAGRRRGRRPWTA